MKFFDAKFLPHPAKPNEFWHACLSMRRCAHADIASFAWTESGKTVRSRGRGKYIERKDGKTPEQRENKPVRLIRPPRRLRHVEPRGAVCVSVNGGKENEFEGIPGHEEASRDMDEETYVRHFQGGRKKKEPTELRPGRKSGNGGRKNVGVYNDWEKRYTLNKGIRT